MCSEGPCQVPTLVVFSIVLGIHSALYYHVFGWMLRTNEGVQKTKRAMRPLVLRCWRVPLSHPFRAVFVPVLCRFCANLFAVFV